MPQKLRVFWIFASKNACVDPMSETIYVHEEAFGRQFWSPSLPRTLGRRQRDPTKQFTDRRD